MFQCHIFNNISNAHLNRLINIFLLWSVDRRLKGITLQCILRIILFAGLRRCYSKKINSVVANTKSYYTHHHKPTISYPAKSR